MFCIVSSSSTGVLITLAKTPSSKTSLVHCPTKAMGFSSICESPYCLGNVMVPEEHLNLWNFLLFAPKNAKKTNSTAVQTKYVDTLYIYYNRCCSR